MSDNQKKVILITGANVGLGLHACIKLCAAGHKVVGTVRSKEKGEICVSEVKAKTPNADITYLICDVSMPSSIKQMVDELRQNILSNGQHLDVLINNAGVSPGVQQTKVTCPHNPEWDATVAANCLGPVYLTDLLLDDLKATAAAKGEARVVFVNSSVILNDDFTDYTIDLNDVMLDKNGINLNGLAIYKNSKQASFLTTQAYMDELEGTNVRVIPICPGPIPGTQLGRSNTSAALCKAMCSLCCVFLCRAGMPQSVEKGGSYLVDAAINDKTREAKGFLIVRNVAKPIPPVCSSEANQKEMLKLARELTGSPAKGT